MGRPTKAQVKHRNRSENCGRPSSITPEKINKLEQAYALDCTDAEACLFADITPSAFYEWQKKNPYFLERKQALKNRPFLIARNSLVGGLKDSPDLALKYLERKKKDEFSTKQESDVKLTFEPLKISRADENDD